jgi:hypothetical protein
MLRQQYEEVAKVTLYVRASLPVHYTDRTRVEFVLDQALPARLRRASADKDAIVTKVCLATEEDTDSSERDPDRLPGRSKTWPILRHEELINTSTFLQPRTIEPPPPLPDHYRTHDV